MPFPFSFFVFGNAERVPGIIAFLIVEGLSIIIVETEAAGLLPIEPDLQGQRFPCTGSMLYGRYHRNDTAIFHIQGDTIQSRCYLNDFPAAGIVAGVEIIPVTGR